MGVNKISRYRKSIIAFLLCIMFAGIFEVDTSAENGALTYGRIEVNMPKIKAEIKGTGYDAASVSASLGSEVLKVDDVHAYDNSKDTQCVYILIDLSTSMRRYFDLVKANITRYISSLGASDKVVAITFGETNVVTVLDGSETREEAVNAINNLQCNENGTTFYEALKTAYEMSNSSVSAFSREYVLVFSDGIDVQKGNATYDEIADKYKSHVLPLYAACSENTSKEAADKFGELARSSGGDFRIISTEQDFDALVSDINNVTLISLSASSNIADGQEKQLSIKAGNLQVEQNVPVARSIPDNTPPTVSDIHYDTDSKAVVISFSEKVDGALDTSAYRFTDKNGEVIKVSAVAAASKENTVEIKLDAVENGEYAVSFSDITDCSQEKNALNENKSFEIKGIKKEQEKKSGLPTWAIVIIVAAAVLVIAGLIVLVAVSNHANSKRQNKLEADILDAKNKEPVVQQIIQPVIQQPGMVNHASQTESEVRHHIQAANIVSANIIVKTGNNASQQINIKITSSIICGRSDICDISIEDAKLSRQHFAIENDNGLLYVSDLQSRNGTKLNGIMLNGRQRLNSGDKIAAGLSDIIIRF